MGMASRRKRGQRAGRASSDTPDSPLAPLVRELREALVAQARAVVEAVPTAAPRARIAAAAGAIQALIETRDETDGDSIDVVGHEPDRITESFADTIAALYAMRFGVLDDE